MRLPDFAQPIADARRRGLRPAELVIVSDGDHDLHRKVSEHHQVVRVRPDQRPASLDWRWLADLDVEIATASEPPRIAALAQVVLEARPWYARVWHLPSDGIIRIRSYGMTRIGHENPWTCEMPPGGRAPDELVEFLRRCFLPNGSGR